MESRLAQDVTQEIKLRMRSAGFTMTKLAEALGVSLSWVSRRLSGLTSITLEDLEAVAYVLDVNPGELLP